MLPIPAGTYQIDQAHSQLGFAVTHLGISVVAGTFDDFDGALTVGHALDDTAVEITARMASVNSGNEMRDQVIRGADWFDVDRHPTMSFRSTAIHGSDDEHELHGELTLRTTTQPVVLSVTYNGMAEFPVDGSTHFGFAATGRISRSAFGISFGVPMVTDEVDLRLGVQFVRPADA